MKDHIILVWLFPILFMVHDFEEIIFLRSWLIRNYSEISERVPKPVKTMLLRMKDISEPAFSLGVAEEFLIISSVTVLSVAFNNFVVWYGFFFAFSLHLIVHILQSVMIKKYIPSLATSIAILPYSIYVYKIMLPSSLQPLMIVSAALSVVFMFVNLYLLHRMMAHFNKWREKYEDKDATHQEVQK